MLQGSHSSVFLGVSVGFFQLSGYHLIKYTHDLGFPGGSVVKNPLANAEVVGVIPGLGGSPEKEMQPTSVFLPGKCLGQRRQEGHCPWCGIESDMIYWLNNNNNNQ